MSLRRRFRRRWAAPALIAAWAALLLLTTECSHRSPYVKQVASAEAAEQPSGAPSHRLLLVGDGGFAEPGSPVAAALAARASEYPENTSVLFLGDNIYPAGLPPLAHEERAEAERHLLAQIEPLRGIDVEVIFVPGNHDWDNSGADGLAALLRQEQFLIEHGTPRTRMIPSGGQPGPVCLDRASLRLVVLDTQWWLHEYERPSDVGEQEVLSGLRGCLESADGRQVVVAAHHPLITHGPHGGFIDWTDHVFPLTRLHPWAYVPLPIIGSLYPLVRSNGVSPQDMKHEKNVALVNTLVEELREARPLLYAAGHDHSLQVQEMSAGPRFHVVSGGGSRPSTVTHDDSTLFAVAQLGFMELDFDAAGRALLKIHTIEHDGSKLVWERWLP